MYWIYFTVVFNGVYSQSGDGVITSQSDNSDVTDDWFPRLNATCVNKQLDFNDNANCSTTGILMQEKIKCADGVYKDARTSNAGKNCVTSQREINCTSEQICSGWSQWMKIYNCCMNETCSHPGVTLMRYEGGKYRTRDCRDDIEQDCTEEYKIFKCGEVRSGPDGWQSSEGSPPLREIALGLAALVMVGLLLFAALRIRKSALQRRRAPPHGREIHGVDNEVGPMPPESRIQNLLGTINTNGRSYELRERSDSTPGRRVYVLSPTPQDPNAPGRGRGFSRTTSQLSSIAEEDAEDALSLITENTEPREDDCFFKYDSDAIKEVDELSSAFDDDAKATSTEAINCINDVIAMYDVDKDIEDTNIEEILKENSRISTSDYRKSADYGTDNNYLNNFGWKPQDRAWKIEKLKDENTKSAEKLSASCSTLNSTFSHASSSRSLGNGCVMSRDKDDDGKDASCRDPLLGNNEVNTLTNLKKEYKSLPSLLDTSQIPDVDEILKDEHVDDDVGEETRV